MKKFNTSILLFVVSIAALWVFTACRTTGNMQADMNNYNIPLYLKDYTPKVSGIAPAFQGRKLCLSNIRNDAANTTNFSYYSKDNRLKYVLSHKSNTPMQLIPSFFWYAYQKAFEHAGLVILDRCPSDVPELWIIFQSFNDEELQFMITLLENRQTIFQKTLKISMPPATDTSTAAMQARAYEMIDLTVKAILSDEQFRIGFQ